MSRTVLVAHPAFYSMGTGVPNGGGRCLGHQIDHSPPSSAKLINEWSYTFIPPICLRGVEKDNYTLFLCFSQKRWWQNLRSHEPEVLFNKLLSLLYNYSQIRPSFWDEMLATIRHWSEAGVIRSNKLQHFYKFKALGNTISLVCLSHFQNVSSTLNDTNQLMHFQYNNILV